MIQQAKAPNHSYYVTLFKQNTSIQNDASVLLQTFKNLNN